MKGVTVMPARAVSLARPEDGRIYVQVDGESAGHLPAEIRIVPQALTLLLPPEYKRAACQKVCADQAGPPEECL